MPKKKITFPEIDAIYQKYGHVGFRMGLQHMIMIGSEHFDDESVEESKKSCVKEEEAMIAEGKIPIMTANFKIQIVLCARELSKIPIWDLLKFVKEILPIG